MKTILPAIFLIVIATLLGFLAAKSSANVLLFSLVALIIFVVSFIKTEWGLYVLIFSMLLSPEIILGVPGKGTYAGRGVTFRFEDFLLIVIGLSWFARNAIKKELGLVLRTPLNKPIFLYLAACVLSTLMGVLSHGLNPQTGFFFVLKYFEFFVVFFMVVNHLENDLQVRRMLFCLILTAFVISIVGILQIPEGGRVSAPFEGETGEPNTLGGYLLFMGSLIAGLLPAISVIPVKYLLLAILFFLIPPFWYTLSRVSYLSLGPVAIFLSFVSKRKALSWAFVVLAVILAPIYIPSVVKQRLAYTVSQPEHELQIEIGDVRLDTSTSARLISWEEAIRGWLKHPVFGHGVTGFAFIDGQYFRVLVETGLIGLFAFGYLLYSIFRMAFGNLKTLESPFYRRLTLGFIAGYIGLLFHSIGANTFIIVRIMEPFWFVAGMVAVLPEIERREMEAGEIRDFV